MLLLSMKKIIIIHSVFLALILGLAGYAYARYWNIALVNGTPISRLRYYQILEQQGGQQILAQLVDDAIIMSEGKAKDIKIDQKIIDEEVTKIEDRLKTQGKTLEASLKANGLTMTDLRYQINLKKIQDTLSAPNTEITQAQIDNFLKVNKALIPAGKTKEELNTLAKNELISQANEASASAWLDKLRSEAKIIYK